MGRHSAPDDDDDADNAVALAGATAGVTDSGVTDPGDDEADARGRHTRPGAPRPRPVPAEPATATVHEPAPASEVPDELPDDAPDDAPDEVTGGLDVLQDVLVEAPETDPAPPAEAPLAPLADAPTVVLAAAPAVEPSPGPGPAPAPAGGHATRHDLALLRAHADVRARAIAAVLAPFVVYAAVLAVVGELRVHSLIWVWAPAVTAGVLVGLVLDAGHRRHPVAAPPAMPEPLAPDPVAPDPVAPDPVREPASPG